MTDTTQDEIPARKAGNISFKYRALGRPGHEDDGGNFYRSAKWCPDGTHALAQCEDRSIQLLKIPTELLEDALAQISSDGLFQQPSPILDYTWYPSASVVNPATYCFVASVRECPVKLIDASSGRLRASYKIVDHRERQVAPHSMAFNCLSSHLYCGYEDAIQVFDFQTPGEGTKIATTPSKKSKDGMKGIVSSIAFCPDYSGLYAASSLSGAITLFTEATGGDAVAYLDGMSGAITQLKFNPMQPHLLYAAQRRSDKILCWDVREPLEVKQAYTRKSKSTNQKLLFDIDPSGKWLITGDEVGDIQVFDLASEISIPSLALHTHGDAIGSVAFHPFEQKMLSVSGSRHFDEPGDSSSDSEDDGESSEEAAVGEVVAEVGVSPASQASVSRLSGKTGVRRRGPVVRDASMKLWSFDGPEDAEERTHDVEDSEERSQNVNFDAQMAKI